MATKVDSNLFFNDLETIQRQLGCRAAEFMRTGKVLESGELMELYAHRHQIKPGKAEAKLILASMLREESDQLKTRRNELGWYWFRHCTRQQIGDLLMELVQCKHRSVNTLAGDLLKHISHKKAATALLNHIRSDAKAAKKQVRTINALNELAALTKARQLPKLRQIAVDSSLMDWLRISAVKKIGRSKRVGDLPLLRGLAADPSPSVRSAVIDELAAYRHPDDAKVVRKLARDRDEHVRYRAIAAIWHYGQPEDRLWLRELVNDPAHPHRAVAVESLAEFKNPADLPLFRTLTREEDYGVQRHAVEALGKFQHPTDVALLKKLSRRHCAAIDALMAYPAKSVAGPFWELAGERDSCVRANLASRLGDWDHPDAPRILRRLTEAKEYDVRAVAVASLGALGKSQDLPLLRRMSQWDTEMVRREAVWAVAKFRRKEDIPFLKERIRDEAPAVRTVAAMALTRLLKRADLERHLEQNQWLRFESMVEFDFALYAPRWLVKAKPRIGDEDIGMALGMMQSHLPEW